MTGGRITLAHGNGGRLTRELVETLFAPALGGANLDHRADAARIAAGGACLAVTTDGFTVQPLEFPGGDIGSLAVHGTVNDLAVSGALPLFMTVAVMIEEGQDMQQLRRIAASLGRAAAAAGIYVAAGDTKVLRRGEGGGVYLSATGVGVPRGPTLGIDHIRSGDALLVSGPVGDHGIAVLLAREEFGLQADVCSDSASVLPLTGALLDMAGLRFMRDPTRGGLATVLHEIAAAGVGVRVREAAIPVRPAVRTVCEILGYDPLYLACEGRVVAAVAPERAADALAAWRALPQGRDAALIGEITAAAGGVTLHTVPGGERILMELEHDPLPRIC